jgi:hypothetical protein
MQTAPQNVNVSVRIGSPGDNGAVTQTIAAGAGATAAATAPATSGTNPAPAQYQAPSAQYQDGAQAQPQAGDASTAAPSTSSAPQNGTVATPVPAAPMTSSLPTTWIWNWTWTCGDTTGGGTTQSIDTGIDTWTWNWNLGGMCGDYSQSIPDIPTVISPVTPNIDFPSVAPVHVGAQTPSELPAALLALTAGPTAPPAQEGAPQPATLEALAPEPDAAPRAPPAEHVAPPPRAPSPAKLAAASVPAPRILLPVLRLARPSVQPLAAATVAPRTVHVAPAIATFPAPSTASSTVEPAPAAVTTHGTPHDSHHPLLPEPFLPLGILGAAGASSGSSGSSIVPVLIALGLWLLLTPPTFAKWWGPLRQRLPRSRSGDAPDRPG